MTAPLIFISYSHDSAEHKEWVLELAIYLRENGIDVILDQWDVELGDDLPKFMEAGLSAARRILMICTDRYLQKANAGLGGVGYEKRILTAQILEGRDQTKVIPIVRNVTQEKKLPTFIGAPLYLDLSGEADHPANREILLKRLHGLPLPKPVLGANPFAPLEVQPEEQPAIASENGASLRGVESTAHFAERFAQAFPGIRGLRWFNSPQEIQRRLLKLLEPPLSFGDGAPIWWWRGTSNLHIDIFKNLGESLYLMNIEELQIARIAAVNTGNYYRDLVYVETIASPPTGLYDLRTQATNEQIESSGPWSEEYGLVDGSTLVSRAEYDDGAALIGDNLVDIRGRVELRARYVTPYNFLIAPKGSPINNSSFDFRCEKILNKILAGTATFEELAEEIRRLPRRPR